MNVTLQYGRCQNPGAGIEQHESTRRGDATDRRLLCRLRRRSGHREERAGPHQAGIVARLQMATGGYRSILFRGGSDQDPDDSEHMIASLDQGGLGLPDRDYYTKEDAKSKETREQYGHLVAWRLMSNCSPSSTAKQSATVCRTRRRCLLRGPAHPYP
jgi:hypothetical protein